MAYPFLAAACWWVMAALSIFASSGAAPVLYVLFTGLFWGFIFVGFASTVYFAIRPIQEVLQGRESLEE
jgi:hypothetical protein